jgi:type IV pilus assembly protein PilN
MSGMGWLSNGQDLLRQRRVERGLPPAAAPLVPGRALLMRGVALGTVPLLGLALAGLWMGWRQSEVARQLDGLRGIPAQVQSLESQASRLRSQVSAIQRSNQGLAKGLVAVSSGSALLAQLAAITPQGIQLTDLQVQGSKLSLKGLANDPQAFRRVNGLSLLLARSPFIQPASVKVIKLTRGQATAQAASPVAWDLSASFRAPPLTNQHEVLQRLGAMGMARRVQLLEQAGVLP